MTDESTKPPEPPPGANDELTDAMGPSGATVPEPESEQEAEEREGEDPS